MKITHLRAYKEKKEKVNNPELCIMKGVGLFEVRDRLLEGENPDKVLNEIMFWSGPELMDQMKSILDSCHDRSDLVEAVSRGFNLPAREAAYLVLGLFFGSVIEAHI